MEAMIPPLDGDRNKGYQVIVIGALFGALASIFVMLRLYVRIFLAKQLKLGKLLGLDDLFVVLGLVSTFSGCQNLPRY